MSEMMPTFEEGEYMKYLQRIDATRTHQGYFSRDKKGNFINSKLSVALQIVPMLMRIALL